MKQPKQIESYKHKPQEQHEHVCTPETCPTGQCFVTALDGPALHFMAGPYPEHAQALADVDKALKIADAHDGRAWFMSWGTVRYKEPTDRIGQLNKFGLIALALAFVVGSARADEIPNAPTPNAGIASVSTVPAKPAGVFHRSDFVQVSAIAAANALDWYTTEHGLGQHNGWHEEELPAALVASKPGFAAYCAVKTLGQGFAQYELDKHNHRKLAGFVADVEIVATFGTDANNLRTAGNYVRLPGKH